MHSFKCMWPALLGHCWSSMIAPLQPAQKTRSSYRSGCAGHKRVCSALSHSIHFDSRQFRSGNNVLSATDSAGNDTHPWFTHARLAAQHAPAVINCLIVRVTFKTLPPPASTIKQDISRHLEKLIHFLFQQMVV
jgi:hypothetical protein